MIKPYYETELGKLYHGCSLQVLKSLKEQGVKVQMCVTSPPYWGLRDYGVNGQIGLESTPEEYTAKMVELFGLVRDVLADDGTLWLNLGDSYAGSAQGWGKEKQYAGEKQRTNIGSLTYSPDHVYKRPPGYISSKQSNGLKPKDLVGIPWRVAFALQAAGWYLRQDIIWHKPNPMPESVTDRCTKAHEYIFMLSKKERYFYNSEAIKERATSGRMDMASKGIRTGMAYLQQGPVASNSTPKIKKDKQRGHSRRHAGFNNRWDNMTREEQSEMGRNKRSVWSIATKPFSEAHFATYPPELITPCILARSRPGDIVLDPFFGSGTTGEVCEKYGRGWVGIELNQDYADIAAKRIERERSQLKLCL